MICALCGSSNGASEKFCTQCGRSLPNRPQAFATKPVTEMQAASTGQAFVTKPVFPSQKKTEIKTPLSDEQLVGIRKWCQGLAIFLCASALILSWSEMADTSDPNLYAWRLKLASLSAVLAALTWMMTSTRNSRYVFGAACALLICASLKFIVTLASGDGVPGAFYLLDILALSGSAFVFSLAVRLRDTHGAA